MFQYLSEAVEDQVKYMKEMSEVQGMLQTILWSNTTDEDNEVIISVQ